MQGNVAKVTRNAALLTRVVTRVLEIGLTGRAVASGITANW
jgi:hypothetical protein